MGSFSANSFENKPTCPIVISYIYLFRFARNSALSRLLSSDVISLSLSASISSSSSSYCWYPSSVIMEVRYMAFTTRLLTTVRFRSVAPGDTLSNSDFCSASLFFSTLAGIFLEKNHIRKEQKARKEKQKV